MNYITIALPKGRLADLTIELLEKVGLNLSSLKESTRKLELFDADNKYKFLFVKPSDVPTYIEYGVADLGVCGKDTLLEAGRDLFELKDLKWGKCTLSICGRNGFDFEKSNFLRVATKYENIAKNYFSAKGQNIEIIKLNGSVELAPIVGLSDVILDIVETGSTLRANDLDVLKNIFEISARLVCNKVSLKTKDGMLSLIENISKAID